MAEPLDVRMSVIRRIEPDDTVMAFCGNVQEAVRGLVWAEDVRDPLHPNLQQRLAFNLLGGRVGQAFLMQQSFSRLAMLKQIQKDVPSLGQPKEVTVTGLGRFTEGKDSYFELIPADDYLSTERLAVVYSMQLKEDGTPRFDFGPTLAKKLGATVAYRHKADRQQLEEIEAAITRCIPDQGLPLTCHTAIAPLGMLEGEVQEFRFQDTSDPAS